MITADNLRDAADRLSPAGQCDNIADDTYICNALHHVAGYLRSQEFQRFVLAEGWTRRPEDFGTHYQTLYFDLVDFPLDGAERQHVRFMLCELLACAIEDGALTIGDPE